ncbi:class I tRNA ligase family protein, partial [Candidatus Microgenomates bacterium]|nr:class I tRNA ligase family protein [Candidatus Microgenomates bacterium]
TLHYVLVRTCQLMAPWVPFLSDYMYRRLRAKSMPASVHLTDWPKPGRADKAVLAQMTVIREVVAEGLAQRSAARIKIRQPLPTLSVRGIRLADRDDLYLVMADELNVKAIDWEEKGAKQIKLDTTISHELKLEGMTREVIRHVQQYRKQLGLSADDVINLALETDNPELKEAIQAFSELINEETQSARLAFNVKTSKPHLVSVAGAKLKVAASKPRG